MSGTRTITSGAVTFASIVVLAFTGVAGAQQTSGIAGVVRDVSGGALPGVSVEASSPALIEKVRSATTDGEGRYNIVDLRPGTYQVVYSLSGFNTVRREGIVIVGGFTAAVNVELPVGALEETITVTGASPIVDIQNTRNQTRVDEELLSTLPSATKGVTNLMILTPGVAGAADVGGTLGLYRSMGAPQITTFHGRIGMKISYDGLGVLNTAGDGNASYIINNQNVQEMALESSGITAESASSGFATNAIPKEGGNQFNSSVSALFSNESLNSNNLTDELRQRGLTTVEKVLSIWDVGFVISGPVKQDRLWFLANVRIENSQNLKAGIFYNKTDKTPFYVADTSRPADRHEKSKFGGGRLTWQASPRNKVNAFFEIQEVCRCPHEGFDAPEAAFGLRFFPQGLAQTTWTSPRTNKFLLEAGFSVMFSNWPAWIPPESTRDDISILELSNNFPYNNRAAQGTDTDDQRWANRFSASYVTGTHSIKMGVYYEHLVSGSTNLTDHKTGFSGEDYGNVSFRFLNGLPNGLTQYATPSKTRNYVEDVGLFAQDQWVIDRLTLNYGLRLDFFYGHIPPQSAAAGEYVPARNFEAVSGVPNWLDINPRLGAAYDVFGNGRTALKFYTGRYVAKDAFTFTGAVNPFSTSVSSVNRTWNDLTHPVGDPRRGNFVADCDLHESGTSGECGPYQNQNFGRVNPSATRYADDLLNGFGVRQSSWDLTTEVQQQIAERVSVTAGYYKSWHTNFRVTDNQLVDSSDFSPYRITAPVDPELPGGGGYEVSGLYDVSAAKFGRVQNLVRRSVDFGDQTQSSDFVSGSFTARFGAGTQLGGGIDTGRTVSDRCFVVDSPQELLNCRTVVAFEDQTQVKLHGSYMFPADVSVAATFQNVPGPEYQANYQAANRDIAPSLGRNLSSCGTQTVCNTTATVPLIAPGTEFEARRTQLDVRLSKTFRIGAARLQANLDVYNALNDGSLLSVNYAYGPSWRLPATGIITTGGSGIVVGRLFQFSGNFTF